MNPIMYEKERIEALCVMSIKCFGSKWAWRKLSERHGIDIDSMELQMKTIINYQEAQIEGIRGSNNASKGSIKGEEVRSGETADGLATTGSDE